MVNIPAGIVSPTYTTFTGGTLADVLRLNTSIAPSGSPNMLGVLGGGERGTAAMTSS